MSKLSVLVITYNEETNIEGCLESVKWADEIVIVDAYSIDKTAEIAKKYTDNVYFNKFKDFSSQKNFALSKASFKWVLSLDADERVTAGLRERVLQIVNEPLPKDGYFIRRSNYIYGKWFLYGGHNKDYQLRLFKKEGAEFYQPVHEKLSLRSNDIGFIDEPIEHYSTRNLTEHIAKINHYTDLEAALILQGNNKFFISKMIIKPIAHFFQHYILQQGFRDGWEGLVYYFISAACDFIKYAKCIERLKAKNQRTDE